MAYSNPKIDEHIERARRDDWDSLSLFYRDVIGDDLAELAQFQPSLRAAAVPPRSSPPASFTVGGASSKS
jgi:hypothetical protein